MMQTRIELKHSYILNEYADLTRVKFDGEKLKVIFKLLGVDYYHWGRENIVCPMVYNTIRESMYRGWMSAKSWENLESYLLEYYNVKLVDEV